jgi:TRAP-type transport system periplasmic protein
MRFIEWGMRATASVIACACGLALALTAGGARAQDKTYVMKVSTPTINASPDLFAKNFAAAVQKDSGGRIKTEVYPASQLGSIPRQIEGTQFGSIQCEVVPPEFMVGLDDRFEIMAAPGLIASMEQGQRLAADPQVLKLMLGLGADKGLRGVGLFMGEQSQIITKTPVRHLADFKGKKIRIFASQFQSVAFDRLGITPVAMSLADVLPAIQQGAIDGAVAGVQVFSGMHFYDAAKYITMTNQPAIFLIVEVNRQWYESLPPDLQQIVDHDAASQSVAINPPAIQIVDQGRKTWQEKGGELIYLPADEQAQMMKTLSTVGADVAKTKPRLQEAYQLVTAAAQRLQ